MSSIPSLNNTQTDYEKEKDTFSMQRAFRPRVALGLGRGRGGGDCHFSFGGRFGRKIRRGIPAADSRKLYNKAGSFEGFCSGGGIAQLADGRTAKEIADAADAGDTEAKEIYAKVGTFFGRGLSILIDILNPEVIVAGSIFTRSRHLIESAMYTELQKETLSQSLSICRIFPPNLAKELATTAVS